jgi:hypothetical protein
VADRIEKVSPTIAIANAVKKAKGANLRLFIALVSLTA